ncbi:FadR/GntR family transcriptional regulator [Rhizobium halophytocola]|uniref:DNA-binding FadR family transcriptional regulator n=1 Tax=Rhizobium halophytocola TaxID=735519 RepID=A0ABS4E0Y6_9HYPH|nr:FadR/GntR family transcriptional regulator [Rhizobium halophytocola]MBP1851604.1 DNA-binding FadR family transcriptional regulator [Rhizobium halophytocola]
MTTPLPSASDNANYALERLRELLSHGEVDEDGKLPTERALCETLGLGRRAIRQALEVLEAEGLIWRRQGSGTYLGPKPSDWHDHLGEIVAGTNFMEIMEVRLRIEPQLAQLAALRAKPADVERMRELAAKITQSGDPDSKELWDGALHRQIALSAGNQLFLSLFDVVNRVRQDEAWQAIRERARSVAGTMSLSNSQHDMIIEAIAARDPGRAGEAMRQHLLMLQERLVRQTSMDHQLEASTP